MTAPETQLAELDTQLAAAVPTGDAEAVEKKRCDRCNLLCDPTEGHARSKSKWVCKDCYATGMTIARHGLNVESDMSPANLLAFYCRCKEERLSNDERRLSYKKTRALVKEQLITASVRRFTETSGGTYKPLSMYAKEGLTEAELKRVQDYCPTQEHPVLGTTYKVDFTSDMMQRVQEEVEQKLLQLETACKKKKTPALQDAEQPQAGLQALENGPPLEDLESDEDAEQTRKGQGKGGKDPAEAERKKAERQAARKAKKDFKGLTALMGRVLPSLRKFNAQLPALQEKLGQEGLEGLPEATREELEELAPRLANYEQDGQKLLAQAAAGKTVWEGATPLTFTAVDVSEALKSTSALARTLAKRKREVAPLQPAKKAKPGKKK